MRLLLTLLLIAVLPVFIWAVLTQRIELRKRAATAEPTQICWNRVIKSPNRYNWPNSCKGSARLDKVCAEILVGLSPQEATQYSDWVNAGRPFIPGCQPTPQGCYVKEVQCFRAPCNPILVCPTKTNINWTTDNASLTADSLKLEVNNLIFNGKPTTPVAIHSDPGNYNYTTLEATWTENNVEMRVNIYFTSDCTSDLPLRCNEWKVSEVRVYNGKSPGDWLVFKDDAEFVGGSRPKAPWGQPLVVPTLLLSSSGGGVHVLTLTNLRLQPFLSETQAPSPTPVIRSCTNARDGATCDIRTCPVDTCPPGRMCALVKKPCTTSIGLCRQGSCIPVPTPTTTISPACGANGSQCTLPGCAPCPPGRFCAEICRQQFGVCQNGRCTQTPVVSTPTPTPAPSPTPTPTLSCNLRAPTVSIVPSNQSAHPGEKVLYNILFTNNDSAACGPSDFTLTPQVSTGWQYALTNTTVPNVSPGQQAGVNFNVTSATTNPTTTSSAPVSVTVKNTRSSLQSGANASYTVVPNPPQSVEFRVKLAGVTGDQADGSKINVKFTKQDGAVLQLSSALTLSHIGNGVYKATAVLTNPFSAGTKFSVQIKGEKHSAIRFTHQLGQTNQCSDSEFITMPAPVPTSYVYDFTGVPLPAGDTKGQDGQVNQTDIDRIVAIMSKPSGGLTADDKLVADLNYDGVVNGYDLFLILQTLRTRCDAN